MKPQRIQRKRTRGWRMPPGARFCGRGTIYGNPFRIGDPHPVTREPMTRGPALYAFDQWLAGKLPPMFIIQRARLMNQLDELLLYDYLACWCRPEDCCHVGWCG